MALNQMRSDINTYLVGKKWYLYLIPFAFGVYIFISILKFDPNKDLSLVLLAPQSFDFGLHEITHILLGFMPPLITASAGSLSEILLGLGLIVGAVKTRCYFAALFCSLWFMLACQSAGIYMADAVPQRLSLVSLGGALAGSDQATHDWHFVFERMHLLGQSALIGNTVRFIGVVAATLGLLFAVWLLVLMSQNQPEKEEEKEESHELYPTAVKGILGSTPIANKASTEDTKIVKGK